MNDKLKMNLQMFADDGGDDNPEVDETNPGADEGSDEITPQFTQEDIDNAVKGRVAREKKEHQAEQARLQKELNELKEAVERAELPDDQQKVFDQVKLESQLSTQQEENKKLVDRISELEQLETKRIIKDKVRKELAERKVTFTDGIVDLLIRDNEEDTFKAVEVYVEDKLVDKNKQASSQSPMGSGGLGGAEDDVRGFDILDKAKVTRH